MTEGATRKLVTAVVTIAERRRLRVSWALEPATDRPVARHDVSIGIDGQYLALPHDGPDPGFEYPHRVLAQSVPVELALRVVTHHADGGPSTTGEGRFTVPPLHHLPATTAWEVGEPRVVVDDATRRDAGLTWWVDGCIGFARLDGTVHGFADNGPHVAHWTVAPDRFLAEVVDPAVVIAGAGGAYAAGGPVLVDPATGALLLVYHGEEHPHGDPADFWSYVGLAVSRDRGATFTDLGRIVTPEMPLDRHRASSLVEVGGAPLVIVGGDVHLYYRDARPSGRWLNMCVARVGLAELFAAAAVDRVAPWVKYHEGRWTEAGLGGAGTDLFPDSPVPRWFDVIHLVDHDRFVMVHSDGLSRSWTTVVRTSTDGLTWSAPERLLPATTDAELLYLTLSSPDLGARREVRGDRVDLYRTRCPGTGAHRWDDASIERLSLRYLGADDPAAGGRSGGRQG